LCEPRLGRQRTAAVMAQWQNIEAATDLKNAFDAVAIEGSSND
jgi:hypothetical protein